MESDDQHESSASGSDSDATRMIESGSDTAYDSEDDALSVESAFAAHDTGLQRPDAVVDLADDEEDDEETEFVILPAAPVAAPDSSSDSEDSLPIGLAVRDASAPSEDAQPPSSSTTTTGKKRKRLRQPLEPSATTAQPTKKKPSIQKPTVIIKPQPTECTVCYDPCTISGRHRLVSLKCGHVFGKKCIDRWVMERKTCPNCSLAVRKADIRPLFTDHVAVVDNAGVEDMAQKYEAEKSRRIQIETELSRAKLQLQFLQTEAKRLQDDAAQWRKQFTDMQCRLASERFSAASSTVSNQVPPSSQSSQFAPGGFFQPVSGQPVSLTPTKPPPLPLVGTSQFSQSSSMFASPPPTARQASAVFPASQLLTPSSTTPATHDRYRVRFRYQLQSSRVCAISSSCALLCVGEAFSSTSFGIVKLSTADTRHAVRIAAHQSPVRDLSISARDDLVLSVAFDGKLVVSNLRSDSVVMQYVLPPTKRNAWSCSFSQVDPFALFCGFHDGTIAKYDMRRPSAGATPVALFELPVRQPVHSIQLCPVMGGDQEQLAAGTFAGFGVWAAEKVQSPLGNGAATPATTFEPVAGCSCVASAQTHRNRLLVTTRTQPQATAAMHKIYELPTMMAGMTMAGGAMTMRSTLTGFRTPQVISRAAMWETRDGNTMVASWDEDHKTVNVWDEATKTVVTRLNPYSGNATGAAPPPPVVDVQHSIASGDWRRARALLGVLSPQQLVLYSDCS